MRDIFSVVSDVLETAADASDPLKGRGHVIQGLEGLRERMRIPVSNGRKSDGERADFMNEGYACTVSHMILMFPFTVNSELMGCCLSLSPSQECCRRCHCLQPIVTCFTGKKTTLVKISIRGLLSHDPSMLKDSFQRSCQHPIYFNFQYFNLSSDEVRPFSQLLSC